MGINTVRLSTAQKQYLSDRMNEVSRSFSLVVPEVESPMADYLSTAYLICRVLDNIEDSLRSYAWQIDRFNEFYQLLQDPSEAETVLRSWEAFDWPGLTDDERRMMGREEGLQLWEIFTLFPLQVRKVIGLWTTKMAEGMARTCNPTEPNYFVNYGDVRLPASYADYNQYCYYVAGTVGRMITDLASLSYGTNGTSNLVTVRDSETCGRALQKTNIVKDFTKDLERNIAFLPDEWLKQVDYSPLYRAGAPAWWKQNVLRDVLDELLQSTHYFMSLPETAVGLRRAVLLMIIPAFETILQAAHQMPNLFTPEHEVKISRTTMGECVLRARKIAADNEAIRNYGQEVYDRFEQLLIIKT
jgi:farnesyl-diphosphate farnesyltransferase